MIVYRCDKCGKEFKSLADLLRVSATVETYDDREGMLYWKKQRSTKLYEVCKDCADDAMLCFALRLSEGGESECTKVQ